MIDPIYLDLCAQILEQHLARGNSGKEVRFCLIVESGVPGDDVPDVVTRGCHFEREHPDVQAIAKCMRAHFETCPDCGKEYTGSTLRCRSCGHQEAQSAKPEG